MTLRESFEESLDFFLENNIFYQRDFQGIGPFEQQYTELRSKENRMYSDEVVRVLPEIPANHPLNREWKVRANSSQKLLRYLRRKSPRKILEVGCGNGWLCRQLAALPESEVIGTDVNETDLSQAARVFSDAGNITFCKADVFRTLPFDHLDCIVLAASIQYFADITLLVKRLLSLLADGGEIHLLDSPFYAASEIPAARHRSEEYFRSHGFPLMGQHYHHHSWKSLEAFNCEILYDPRRPLNRVFRAIVYASPFPWIVIMQ